MGGAQMSSRQIVVTAQTRLAMLLNFIISFTITHELLVTIAFVTFICTGTHNKMDFGILVPFIGEWVPTTLTINNCII